METKLRIVVVDDDPALASSICMALEPAGYEIACALNGKDGIRQICLGDADRLAAALVDIRLPDMNGLEVLREARTIVPDLGVIMMTGGLDTKTVVSALNHGAVAYIQKPFRVEELYAVVAKTVDRHNLILRNHELVRRLRGANAELEARVEARTAELANANARLATTVRMLEDAYDGQSRFVAMVSHELNTPMHAVILAAGTLMQHAERLDKPTTLRLLYIISDEVHRLARLVTSVLDLSRLHENGHHAHLGKTDLRAVVDEVLGRLAKSSLRCEVAFDPDTYEAVTDKDQIEQVLVNLIGNAVKYTPAGGAVRVSARRDGHDLVVCVADSGPGIPEAEREHVFDAFYRTRDAVNAKSPGTGLGLTITKAVVEGLGGRVWLDGSERGSRFYFSIPLEARS